MTRRHSGTHKKKGGVLTGLRGGVRKAAKVVASDGKGQGRTSKIVWNVVTAILIAVAAAFVLRRLGVINF